MATNHGSDITAPTGTVTFLFTDIEGSTRLLHSLGPEYETILEAHNDVVRAAVATHAGVIMDNAGDGFFVAFARAVDAVAAAIDVQLALDDHRVRVRMGIHTGAATLGQTTYIGMAVHEAARIGAAGHGGQILISDATRQLVRDHLPDGIDLVDLGEHRLKDLVSPQHLFQVRHDELATDFPPLRTFDIRRHNLPEALTSFVGRDAEVLDVTETLTGARLVTLTGAGGCGKSRLAIEAARVATKQFTHGAWLVELAPVLDETMVVPAVAAALGVRSEAGGLETLVTDYLRAKDILVVLDNCEHLVDACATLVATLLEASPGLHVLCTSREPLGVAGEIAWRVPSLPDDDAKQLFTERARLIRPGFAIAADEADALHSICRQLEGIPLALELAASRISLLSVAQIATKLADSFRLLTGGNRTSLARQQTLQATVDWSHDLLSVAERAVFRRLSVFAGGFTLEAAEVVCEGGSVGAGEIFDLLSELVHKSLVQAEPCGHVTRYRMLETLRQYGATKLRDAGEVDQFRAQHLTWALALANQAEAGLMGPNELEWMDRLDQEHDNLRAALRWSLTLDDRSDALRLVIALFRYWTHRGGWYEALPWATQALEGSESAPAPLRALVLGIASFVASSDAIADARQLAEEALRLQREEPGPPHWLSHLPISSLGQLAEAAGRSDEALAFYLEALEIARASGSPIAQAKAAGLRLAVHLRRRGETAAAREYCEEALALLRRAGTACDLPIALLALAGHERAEGNIDRADELAEEALVVARATGVRVAEISAHLELSINASQSTRSAAAIEHAELAVAGARDLGQPESLLRTLNAAAYVELHSGRAASARTRLAEALVIARAANSPSLLANVTHSNGEAALVDGDLDAAAAFFDQAAELFAIARLPALFLTHDQATLARRAGRFREAQAQYLEVLQQRIETKQPATIAHTLRSIGALLSAAGDAGRAAQLFGAADALFGRVGPNFESVPLTDYDELRSRAEASLGTAEFATLHGRGAALTLDEVVALAEEPVND